jgi:hypothetical protein
MKSLILFVLPLVASCASFRPDISSFQYYSQPVIGVESVKGIGDTILFQAKGARTTVLTILEDIEIASSAPQNKVKAFAGSYYRAGTWGDYIVFEPLPKTGAKVTGPGVLFTTEIYYFLVATSSGDIRVGYEYGQRIEVLPQSLPKESCSQKDDWVAAKGSLQQALIYAGKQGNTIRLAYNELVSNAVGAPFTVEVNYDLADSNIITYKEARIEVLEASNNNLRYRVLSGFNPLSN